jgi:hypothetical protein
MAFGSIVFGAVIAGVLLVGAGSRVRWFDIMEVGTPAAATIFSSWVGSLTLSEQLWLVFFLEAHYGKTYLVG